MSGIGAMTVFMLGLRHGADPDHLAAIDNVTRNAHAASPRASRFTGVLFAAGHSIMVLGLAVVFATLASRFAGKGLWIELAGGWLSVAILLAIAVLNLRALMNNDVRPSGLRTRMLPRALREARNPLIAVPIGMLFGLGFETSSQIAAYGAAFSQGGGALAGIIVGIAFCGGLIVTDALDGFLVHHVVAHRSNALPAVAKLWLWCVTLFAIGVAAYDLVGLVGVRFSARADLIFGSCMVAALIIIFSVVCIAIRIHDRRCRNKKSRPAAGGGLR